MARNGHFKGRTSPRGTATSFPGLQAGKGRQTPHRAWDRPVTSRAYLYYLRVAADRAGKERADHRKQGLPHPFDEYPLELLGTHSMKVTGLSVMKDVCSSTVLVGAVAGTTAKTVERVYDQPTYRRQQRLVEKAFEPIVHELAGAVEVLEEELAGAAGGPAVGAQPRTEGSVLLES